MHPKLYSVFTRAEQERKQILETVSKLPAEKFFYRRGKRWSISQILTHLLTAERMSLQYMKKKSLGINQVDNSGWLETVKITLLKISQRLPLRYKAPAKVLESTPEALSLSEIEKQWGEFRAELEAFLNQMDAGNIRKKIYKHPVVGRLDVVQAVSFFREHINHHLPQINRLL